LALVLDEPKNTDELFSIDGFQYVIDKALFAAVKPIKIDFSPLGFSVTGNPSAAANNYSCATCG